MINKEGKGMTVIDFPTNRQRKIIPNKGSPERIDCLCTISILRRLTIYRLFGFPS